MYYWGEMLYYLSIFASRFAKAVICSKLFRQLTGEIHTIHPLAVPFNWCHQLFMRVGSSRARRPPLPNVLRVWYEKNCYVRNILEMTTLFQVLLQIIFKFWDYWDSPFEHDVAKVFSSSDFVTTYWNDSVFYCRLGWSLYK